MAMQPSYPPPQTADRSTPESAEDSGDGSDSRGLTPPHQRHLPPNYPHPQQGDRQANTSTSRPPFHPPSADIPMMALRVCSATPSTGDASHESLTQQQRAASSPSSGSNNNIVGSTTAPQRPELFPAKGASSVTEAERATASLFRTKLCENWSSGGGCSYKTRCVFAHGPDELRTTQQNLRDGLVDEATIQTFKRFIKLKRRGVDVRPPPSPQYARWGEADDVASTLYPQISAVSQEQQPQPQPQPTLPTGTTAPIPPQTRTVSPPDVDQASGSSANQSQRLGSSTASDSVSWYRLDPYSGDRVPTASPNSSSSGFSEEEEEE